jgi:hypothetical protein
MKAVIRSWGNNKVMVLGTMTSDLPPGDYALEIGIDLTKAKRLVPVPQGMIPAGMDAAAILTSGIDLSDAAVKNYVRTNGSVEPAKPPLVLSWTEVPVTYGRRFVNDLVHGFVQVVEQPDGSFRVGRGLIDHKFPSELSPDSVISRDDQLVALSEVERPEFDLSEHTAHVQMGYSYFYDDDQNDYEEE